MKTLASLYVSFINFEKNIKELEQVLELTEMDRAKLKHEALKPK